MITPDILELTVGILMITCKDIEDMDISVHYSEHICVGNMQRRQSAGKGSGALTLSRALCMSSTLSMIWPVSCQSTFSSAAAASPLAAARSLFRATAEGGSM